MGQMVKDRLGSRENVQVIFAVQQNDHQLAYIAAQHTRDVLVYGVDWDFALDNMSVSRFPYSKDSLVDVVFAEDLFKPGGVFGELTQKDVYMLSLNCHDRDFVVHRILGLTFDNLVEAAQQAKLELHLDASTDLSLDQVVPLVVEQARIVRGKARAKRLAAGWGRFTWPNCPPGGVEATAEAVLANLKENFLKDAVAPVAKLVPDGLPLLVPRQQLPDGISWEDVLQRHFDEKTVPDIKLLTSILHEVVAGDRRPIAPHLKMDELAPCDLQATSGATAAPRPPVTLHQLCPGLLSQFEGLDDIDVIAVIDGATAKADQTFRPVHIRAAPALLLGTMGRAFEAAPDLYLPTDGCFRNTFALLNLDEPQEAVKATVTPMAAGQSGGHYTWFRLAQEVPVDNCILLGRHKHLGSWTFALRPSPDDDSVCEQCAAATQEWLDHPGSWQAATGASDAISRPLSSAIDQQQVQGPTPALTLPGEFLEGLPGLCPATFCGVGFGNLNVYPTSLRGAATLQRLEDLMHAAAAHGAQRLTLQRNAGGLYFTVDHMDEAAEDEICAITDPKQPITVHDTFIAFDRSAGDDCFSNRTNLPGPAALVLRAWQEADQRGRRQLSVCSSGVQIGTVVIRRLGIDGCVIVPFDLMVEEMTGGLGADADAFTLHAADGELHWTFTRLSPATAAAQARRVANGRKLFDAGEYVWQHGQLSLLGVAAAAAAESVPPAWTRSGPGDETRSALPPADTRLHVPGEEVAALLGLASPPCFTQLSVTMCGQMAAASRAPVTSGSLRFWANTKKLLNTVQRLADEHQLHVEVTLRADGSADGLLLSFGGLSAELEQQAVDMLHSGSSRWFAWDDGYRTRLRDFDDGCSLRLGGPAKDFFETVPCESTICIDEALVLPVSVQREGTSFGTSVRVRAPEMAQLLQALLVTGQQRGSSFLTLRRRHAGGGIVGLDRVPVTGAEVLTAMDQVKQHGPFTRVGHGVVNILLTELEQSHSYGPNIPGQVLREVGAITGSTLLATRKRLSFAGEPLCDGPGEALTQRQSGRPQLQGGGGLKYWLSKVLRSEAADVPAEQELRLTARMAAGEGSNKVLWLDVTAPGLAISIPKVVAAYKRARGPDSTWLRVVAGSSGRKTLERPAADIQGQYIASSAADGHLAEDLHMAAIREAAQLRPTGKPAAELRLPDSRWVANLTCRDDAWRRSSWLHLCVSTLGSFQPILAALRGARPAGAPAEFRISLAADPEQVKAAAAAIKDLTHAPPVIFLGLGKEILDGDEFLAKLAAAKLNLGSEFLPQTNEALAAAPGNTWDMTEAALPGAVTVARSADNNPWDIFNVPGDVAIAPALATFKEAALCNEITWKPTAELRLHGGDFACRLAVQPRRWTDGYHLKPAGVTEDDLVSALQAGLPAGAPADFTITLSTVEADTRAAIAAGAQDRWAPPPPVFIGVRGQQLDTSKVVACLADSGRIPQWQRPDDTAGTGRGQKRKAAI